MLSPYSAGESSCCFTDKNACAVAAEYLLPPHLLTVLFSSPSILQLLCDVLHVRGHNTRPYHMSSLSPGSCFRQQPQHTCRG
jgi:hypothetical protein